MGEAILDEPAGLPAGAGPVWVGGFAFDAEGGSGEGGYYGGMPKDKNSREERNENAAGEHPAKGRILDIRGS